jgi:hypothetical protein
MKRFFQILGALFTMWLAGGCAARALHRAIPGCASAEAYVPRQCYSVVMAGKVEVRCPDSTTTYSCGKK